jgi:hypothetical protein
MFGLGIFLYDTVYPVTPAAHYIYWSAYLSHFSYYDNTNLGVEVADNPSAVPTVNILPDIWVEVPQNKSNDLFRRVESW